MRAFADEFLATVTEHVGHSVYKVVIRLSFGVIQQYKVNRGIEHFATVSLMTSNTNLTL